MAESSNRNTILAVVFGASEWPLCPSLPGANSFAHSAKEFVTYLQSEDGLAIPDENLLNLFDLDVPADDLDSKISSFLAERQKSLASTNVSPKDLLIYYVGHGGFISGGQEYFFAIRRTRENGLGASSIRVADLAMTLKRYGKNLRRYLILDCCFAAAVFSLFQAGTITRGIREKTLKELPKEGTALLCAASKQDFAINPPGGSYTMFSEALLDVLHHGDPKIKSGLSLSQIGEHVEERIKHLYSNIEVRPQVLSPDQRQGDIAELPLFPNVALKIVGLEEHVSTVECAETMRLGVSKLSEGTDRLLDGILRPRLKALAHNLLPIEQPSKWEGAFTPQLRVPQKLWSALDQHIGIQAETLRKKILNIVDGPDEITWLTYRELVAESEPIFGESLEVLRGLAVRDKMFDEKICEIADHLILDCSEVAFENPSLTVPASHEALARTMGRILRIRFPEWTVWTFPLIALEYGHVIVEEPSSRIKEPMKKLFNDSIEPEIATCLHSLFAEAFATYIMGPSYAYAMILLRLDAQKAFMHVRQHAAPDIRVKLILFMLERMNEVADEKYYKKPYVDSISILEESWAAMVASAHPIDESPIGKDEIKLVLEKIWEVINTVFRVACYPISGDTHGWSTAEAWIRKWMLNLRENQDLTTDLQTFGGKLRDILNAAWICRIKDSAHTDVFANAARKVCEAIVNREAIVNPASLQSSSRRVSGQSSSARKRAAR